MPRPKGSKNLKLRSDNGMSRKQICSRGHDTFITGRYNSGNCKICDTEYQRNNYVAHPILKKQFCIHGHDIRICGRDKNGGCKDCIKEFYLMHKKEIIQRNNEREKERMKIDPIYKLAKQLRHRLREAIKHNYKTGSSVKDLGCSLDFLKQYIEYKFYNKMAWNNWGPCWELDHIVALWKFDLTDREQLLKAVNYKNLQPLTIEDHTKKSIRDRREYFEHAKQKGKKK